MEQKISSIIQKLSHGLTEREPIIKAALLATLSGEMLMIFGPLGTSKNLVAQRLAECLEHQTATAYFEYLLTSHSKPEEIFGPLSKPDFKAEPIRHQTAGYLPSANLAFIDEIFAANTTILNALLTILQERVYHNGGQRQPVPLRTLIAATSHLPLNKHELATLYDCFLVRVVVNYIKPQNLARLFNYGLTTPQPDKISAAELHAIQINASAVAIPANIIKAIQSIWLDYHEKFKQDQRENLSDHRLKKAIHLLRVSATTNGRTEVNLSDVVLLKDCLWNHPDNAPKIHDLVINTLRRFSHLVPTSLAPHPNQVSAEPGTVVAGFRGRGTLDDPLLISTPEEFLDLHRADVGQQGYYFRQTTDLDCSQISTWPEIVFYGHYDGNGHSISHNKNLYLFVYLATNSSLTNLHLQHVGLAKTANNTHLSAISSSWTLLQCAHRCTLVYCSSDAPLIEDKANHCTISDCVVRLDLAGSMLFNPHDEHYGGIAKTISDSCIVERCLVTGHAQYQGAGFFHVAGIANICTNSTIRQCVLGPFDISSNDVRLYRIASHFKEDGSVTLSHNAAIDSNTYYWDDKSSQHDCETIAATRLTQRYFEHTLGWDFTEVWQWDDTQSHPSLRALAIARAMPTNMTDLLTAQMRANLWL